MKLLWLGLCLLGLLACSGTEAGQDVVAVEEVIDGRGEVAAGDGGIVLNVPDALPVKDSGLFPGDVEDVEAELPTAQCAPGEGCFLDECSGNDDCQSGWCVQHLGEGVCTQSCQSECPPGWNCLQVAGTEPDVVYICVSEYANLCRPCGTNGDCVGPAGTKDACLDYGSDGYFCGGPCGEEGACPWGFSCQEAITVEGSKLQQCVNDTGECPCTDSSIALGLTTPCVNDNDMGICQGKRTCTQSGLSTCDAEVPAPETCDGLDNDCDDETDEPSLVDGDYVNLCDDGNECTLDKCTGASGCVNEVLESGPCEDGDPCTVADHCQAGTCLGDPVVCDDANPCTDNLCTETGGCEYPANLEGCDDGDPCTVADQCQEGACAGTAIACDCQTDADCAALEDGNLCNGTLVCDLAKLPYQCVVAAGTVVVCPEPEGEGAICLQAACAPATGECSLVPDHEGLVCANSNICTVNDQCAAGVCEDGEVVNCNDGNPCTDDGCDPTDGCTHQPNITPCNDGDVCTTVDACSEGACLGGPALDCDDGEPCTLDECTPLAGCIHTNQCNCDLCSVCVCDEESGNVSCIDKCVDDNLCTVDSCAPETGLCNHQFVVCEDDDVCTTNICEPLQGCITSLNEAPCDDGDVCTLGDHCHLGACISAGELACGDNNPCTADSCNPDIGCQFAPIGGECPGGECANGVCQPNCPGGCDDENPCTDDLCTGQLGCVHVPNALPCDDLDPCTTLDICAVGACQGSAPLPCNDDNPCTDDSCAVGQGCQYVANQVPCDDGNVCTVGDLCGAGICGPGAPLDCDDNDQCTDDACNPESGCAHADIDPCEAVYKVPSQYATIQAAIDAAGSGEKVLVADGTYTGAGNKDLDFKGKAVLVTSENGAGKSIIDCENLGRGVYFHSGESNAAVLDGFTIKRGFANEGGAIHCVNSSPTLRNLILTQNEANTYGGALYFNQGAKPVVEKCTISGNSAGSGGGGIFFKSSSSPKILKCAITGNTTAGNGGGICAWDSQASFVNLLIALNAANGQMGGLYFHNCQTTFANCTVAENQGGGLEANGYNSQHDMINSIFWNNPPTEFAFSYQAVQNVDVTAVYSDIKGGYPGTGNFESPPAFVNPAADFHLTAQSLCVDSGTVDGAPEDDLEGELRPQGNQVDIGAYESPYSSNCIPKCEGKVCGSDGCEGSCGDCPAEYYCYTGACKDKCIPDAGPGWYTLTGHQACAEQGLSCVGLQYFSADKVCGGSAYEGCWGAGATCCDKSVGGHVGGGHTHSAKWKCE